MEMELIDVEERRRKNLTRILEAQFDGNQAALARAIQRKPAMVWKLLADGSYRKPIGEKLARHLERALGMADGALDGVAQVALPEGVGNEVKRLKQNRAYDATLVSPEGALRWALGKQLLPDDAIGVAFANHKLGENSVALTVSGSAMEPVFANGDRIFVDRDVEVAPTVAVLAVVSGNKAMVRKYRPLVDDGSSFQLMPYNADYAVIDSSVTDVRIVAVVIEHHRYRGITSQIAVFCRRLDLTRRAIPIVTRSGHRRKGPSRPHSDDRSVGGSGHFEDACAWTIVSLLQAPRLSFRPRLARHQMAEGVFRSEEARDLLAD